MGASFVMILQITKLISTWWQLDTTVSATVVPISLVVLVLIDTVLVYLWICGELVIFQFEDAEELVLLLAIHSYCAVTRRFLLYRQV